MNHNENNKFTSSFSGIIAAGSLLVSGVGQMAFAADTTSAGSAATGSGSSSTGSGAASLSATILGVPITASGSGSSSTGSSGASHSGGGLAAICSGTIPPITIGGGCSSAP